MRSPRWGAILGELAAPPGRAEVWSDQRVFSPSMAYSASQSQLMEPLSPGEYGRHTCSAWLLITNTAATFQRWVVTADSFWFVTFFQHRFHNNPRWKRREAQFSPTLGWKHHHEGCRLIINSNLTGQQTQTVAETSKADKCVSTSSHRSVTHSLATGLATAFRPDPKPKSDF